MVEEARLDDTGSGLVPVSDGWFVVNVRDAAWETNDRIGHMCAFENPDAPFATLGINVRVLWPGRTKWRYHAEDTQEGFLVLAGECLLLVEDEERPLGPWDFVHCPPGTAHAFVATGEGPCVIVMVGAPRSSAARIATPQSELALRHDVAIERVPEWRYERPEGWGELPWA
jgi:uncharacterized cupin superfamily protein